MGIGSRRAGPASGWLATNVGAQAYAVETIATADDFSDPDGIAVLRFKQAQEAARAQMVKRAHASVAKPEAITVQSAIDDYIAFLETNRKSAGDARYRADALILATLGDVEAEALTTDQLRRWHNDLAKTAARVRTRKGQAQQHRELADDDEAKRRRRSSANRTLTVLKAALNRAWRDEQVSSNAAWRRVEPFEGVEAARVRYLTVAEAQRLINASDPEFRVLVQAALQTGARYGELARLQVHDFNPDAGTLAVRQSKSGKPRHVDLTEEGAEFFGHVTAGRAGDELMFSKNGSPWLKSHQARPMADASARAKITPSIGFHGLRHTWASLATMNGVPLLVVAKNLGHVDSRMVERHYGHLAPSYIRDAIRSGGPRFGVGPISTVRAIR